MKVQKRKNELVSVVIPTYNREKTILGALNSVLEQTYGNIEVIVVDDGSTDNTRKLLENIQDERLHYIHQDNQGACIARNHGIECSSGRYIAFHDSDDVWHKEKLEKQISCIEKSGADIVFCKLLQFKNGKVIDIIPNDLSDGMVNPVTNLFGIGTQTLLCKREVFGTIRFDASLPRFQEFELLLQAVENNCRLYCLDEGLVDYYIGSDSISSNPQKLSRACALIIRKHNDFLKRFPKMAEIMSCKLLEEAYRQCDIGNKDYIRYMEQAYEYHKTKNLLFKIAFGKIGVYPLLRKIKNT